MPINYSYAPQGAVLETDNPQGREIQQFMMGFARRGEDAPARRPTDRGGMPVRSGAREGGEPLRAAQEHAAIEEARARVAQARAISDPAPMRSIRGGPGMVGGVGRAGLQLDTSGMTGAQRNALLPSSAAMAAIPPSGASLDASTLPSYAGPSSAPMANDWYSLPDHVRKAMLIQSGYGNNVPVQQQKR